jgi:hypothetical protein
MEQQIGEIKSVKATIPLETFVALGGKVSEGMDIISYDHNNEPIHWNVEEKKDYALEMLSKYSKHNVSVNICLFDSVCIAINELQGSMREWNIHIPNQD